MIDTPTSNNHRDFNARYSGTFGFLHTDQGSKILVRVGTVNQQKVHFTDIKGQDYFALLDKNVMFEFIPVNRGYYNTRSGTVLLMRVPARQWHRGICTSNTKCLVETYTGNLGNINGTDHFFSVLHDVFVEPLQDTKFCFDRWKEGARHGVALSKFFYLDTKRNLQFLNSRVGIYDRETNKLILTNTLVEQEVKDVVRRLNLDIEVQNG